MGGWVDGAKSGSFVKLTRGFMNNGMIKMGVEQIFLGYGGSFYS